MIYFECSNKYGFDLGTFDEDVDDVVLLRRESMNHSFEDDER